MKKRKVFYVLGLCLVLMGSACGHSTGKVEADNMDNKLKSAVTEAAASTKDIKEASSSAEADKRFLTAQYHEMWEYMTSKNIEKLAPMMRADFHLIHMTGTKEGKEAYLADIKNRQLDYHTEENDSVDVTVHGDKATVVGKSRVNASVYGGSAHTWRLQLTFDYVKENGRWLQTECRATTY